MGPLDAFWHLLNLFTPAIGLGMISAVLAKLLWRRELSAVRYLRLAGWACCASAAALIAGLILTGQDGRMVTYAGMVLACALALGWVGFGRRRG